MNQALNIIPRLRRLAEIETALSQLEDDTTASASLATEIESLRAVLPTAILNHHDARRVRGKVSVAPVTRGICRACHLAIPRGRLAELHKVADELSICDNCGAFIYLGETDQSAIANAPKIVAVAKEKGARAKRTPRRSTGGDAIPVR